MNPVLSLELPYPNTSGNSHVRHGGGRHYLTKDAQDYRRDVERQAMKHRAQRSLAGPLELRWVLAPPDLKARDQTNVLKVVEDALVRCGVLSDDSNKVIRRTVVDWVGVVPGGAIFVEGFMLEKCDAISGVNR